MQCACCGYKFKQHKHFMRHARNMVCLKEDFYKNNPDVIVCPPLTSESENYEIPPAVEKKKTDLQKNLRK